MVDVDEFKRIEKRIKSYMKDVAAERRPMSKRQRMKLLKERAAVEHRFNWDEVFDPLDTTSGMTLPSPRAASESGEVHDLSFIAPGLYLVVNSLSPKAQLYWAKKALIEYSTAEHNNLSNLKKLNASNETKPPADDKVPVASELATAAAAEEEDYRRLWELSMRDTDRFQRFEKLRWSCLGYHYDWTRRMYRKNLKSDFPEDLACLCNRITGLVGKDLVAEAAIVNYYPVGTSMGGHLDDAEHTMAKPIVSISIGCSALFLIGGRDRSVRPTPILLRSGDAIVMSGESRYSYHGIPFVLPIAFQPLNTTPLSNQGSRSVPELINHHVRSNDDMTNTISTSSKCFHNLTPLIDLANEEDSLDVEQTKIVVEYLQQARINMNVRQVRIDTSSDDAWIDKTGSGASAYRL